MDDYEYNQELYLEENYEDIEQDAIEFDEDWLYEFEEIERELDGMGYESIEPRALKKRVNLVLNMDKK